MNIYDKHNAAFKQVSAYVIVRDGKQVGKIAFKYPKDGAGRLYCYLHICGLEMVQGYAGGYGYDKKGAAFESACEKLYEMVNNWGGCESMRNRLTSSVAIDAKTIAEKGQDIGGKSWDGTLRAAGYEVWSAV